ncbi:hypothetical protein [Vibrio phage VP4B]|uniref:Uncharacterized protein n=1 Tax=Vibrio phage VP4B TaxID=1262540 RepID=V9LZM3_9CAUD|nr:hypothetical protein FDJ61_gp026 [Vibrio phage VP4B]AGB07140.1 hypothetical protein [Vibrio phage VP4B]
MDLLSIFPLTLFALVLVWALLRQTDQDGVESLLTRCISNRNAHLVCVYHSGGDQTYLSTFFEDVEQAVLGYDEHLQSYTMTLPLDCKNAMKGRMEALKALANSKLGRTENGYEFLQDMVIIEAILTGELQDYYNEWSRDQIKDAHDNWLTHLETI